MIRIALHTRQIFKDPPRRGTKARHMAQAGRPKGAKNKMTIEIRERIKDFLELSFDEVAASFTELEAKEKITLWLKLAEFVIPKVTRQDITPGEQKGDPLTDLMTPR